MIKKLCCIVCPMGCSIEVECENGEVKSVKGNSCPRGKKYAISEITAPTRVLTSTVRCENGKVVSVKTSTAIPKEKMFECMLQVNKCIVKLPIHIGDVIIKNIINSGADLIATQEAKYETDNCCSKK